MLMKHSQLRASKAKKRQPRRRGALSVSARKASKSECSRIGLADAKESLQERSCEALQQTYENAKVEISELRRVEAVMSCAVSRIVAKDKESLSVAFQTLKQEHAALRKDDEQTKKRLEFEAIKRGLDCGAFVCSG